jgi:hypothetical protein
MAAILRVASSRLGAVLVLAPLAAAMRDAVLRSASSRLGAPLVLAPLPPPVRHAVLRAQLRQRQHVRPAAAVAPFSASFQCYSLTSRVRASNRSWLLSRSLVPA